MAESTKKIKKVEIVTTENSVTAIGRRKSATARVRVTVGGKGDVVINDRPMLNYFGVEKLRETVYGPFELIGRKKDFDVAVKVLGGGLVGQSEAIRLGIARSLVKLDSGLKSLLRAAGFLTRNSREKERKKPGLKKARKAPQWSKR